MFETIIILLALIPLIFIFFTSINKMRRKEVTISHTTSSPPSSLKTKKANGNEKPDSEGAKLVEKTKLTLPFILILFFIALTVIISLSAFMDKRYQPIFYVLGSLVFIPIGIAIGAIFSSNIRIKMLRALTKKNIGFVKFITSRKIIKPVIANLDRDIIRFGEGIYIVNKKFIKRESPDDTYSYYPIDPERVKYEEGIPVIYFDIDDIMPLDFNYPNAEEQDKFRIPSQVSATLNKEIAVEKAKVMNAFASRQNIFMIIVIGALLISLYLVWSNYNTTKELKKIIEPMKSEVSSVSDRVGKIEDKVNNIFTIGNNTAPILLVP